MSRRIVSTHDDFIASLLRYLDSKGIQSRIIEEAARMYVEQSEITGIWYVRDSDGTIVLERETKESAERALARLNKAN